jgi:cyclomaltodextrinase
MKNFGKIIIILVALCSLLRAQDDINVTFRYFPTSANVQRAFVPGTFNNWGPNNNGIIAVNAPSLMTYVDSLKCHVKTITLAIGATHEYKFHEHYNGTGSQNQWFTDPLNPLIDTSDNNNSIINVDRVIIFQVSPKEDAVVTEEQPFLTAGVYVANNDAIVADQSAILLDGAIVSTFSGHLMRDYSILSYQFPALQNGVHSFGIHVITQQGESRSYTSQFSVASGDVFFTTPSVDTTLAGFKTIRWHVGMAGKTLRQVQLKQIGKFPIEISPTLTEHDYEFGVDLRRGENKYVISVTDATGTVSESDTLRLLYPEAQKPEPTITFQPNGGKIQISGEGNDPQKGIVSYRWFTQPTNPMALAGIDNRTDKSFEIDAPSLPGDYAVKLVVTDSDGYSNSTVNFFTIGLDSSIAVPALWTVPLWVAQARIYCMFIKSYTSQGTIKAAAENLEHIKNMGFNVIWILPVMDVEGEIDQNANIGYNIVNFYRVDPGYGTNQDFKTFVETAHELGLRVILDVTPNHSSRSHGIALDVRSKRKFSRYYDFYQHEVISHDTNGLGQTISADGIVYYSGFSDALLNWNWGDPEARQYMLDVYTYWLREFDIDGFRMDVYWGPHRRYGRDKFDVPLRNALRSAKADIMILGETAGTGSGTEEQYADTGGGMDLGYDWNLFGTLSGFPSISSLDNSLYNSGFRPGSNSYFLRFLENHDEYRVAYRYNSVERTIPVSTAIFLTSGIPLLYQGQEVGMGFEMSGSKEFLARSTIDWNRPQASVLAPHYQKLAQIRGQFPAFYRQMEDSNSDGRINGSDQNIQSRLSSSSSEVYVYARPWPDQNGLVIMNYSNKPIQFKVPLNLAYWGDFSSGFQADKNYYLNDLYNNFSQPVSGVDLDTLHLNFGAYQVAVYTISTSEEHVTLPRIIVQAEGSQVEAYPVSSQLLNNYPNPFNPRTTIPYSLAEPSEVRLEVFNLLGQRLKTLVSGSRLAGQYRAEWDGTIGDYGSAPSGIYLIRFQAGKIIQTKKAILAR